MKSKKTEDSLICSIHTERSVEHPAHSPNNLSGAPAAQIPESCEIFF